jgi:hypothetical protein
MPIRCDHVLKRGWDLGVAAHCLGSLGVAVDRGWAAAIATITPPMPMQQHRELCAKFGGPSRIAAPRHGWL